MTRLHDPTADFFVVEGVRLQFLDWGGTGPALVFLAGYANTPHFFDSLARMFTDRFRVLGLTRRAHGESDQPDAGYDVPTLAGDAIELLDELGLESASFAGHSFAGAELCCLATDHPRRVDKLVFFDTLYDYTEEDLELLSANPLPPSDPPPDTFESVAAYCEDFVTRYASYRRLRSPRWDALWAHSLVQVPDGRYRERIRPETANKLFRGLSSFHLDLKAIRCPTLAFFAFQDENWFLPEIATDELRRAMKQYIDELNTRTKRNCIERVRREIDRVRIVEFADTSHYCFLDRAADVSAAMQTFL
ncbi:alpha/beta hydrolase [Candidatus Bipolaricaulota bacterium]|nr:alpha/beta hydrolase [Candidatus Bipolaricaulota bacterium]